MSKRLLLIGGGGHCGSVLDSVIRLNFYEDIGVIDIEKKICYGVPVVGTDDDLPRLLDGGWTDAFVSLGSIGRTEGRRVLFDKIKTLGFNIPSIIDTSAIIAKEAQIAEGCYIGKNAVVNTGAIIHDSCIINTGSIVEHNCEVGEFTHISPGAIICGETKIGHDTHVGAGCVVRQNISIGNNVLVGAGSVVVNDIPDNTKAYGNPCKVIEMRC